MKRSAFSVWITGFLLATFAIGAIAPAAEARQGSRRFGGSECRVVRYRGYAPTAHVGVQYRSSHSSDFVPVLAGFIGGLVVGNAISKSSHSHDDGYYRSDDYRDSGPDYDYYDPYCDESFASLSAYKSHACHRHPVIVRVINVETGRCAHVYRYQNDRWVDYDEDWGDE
jgi:uncharacterized protein YgiB involved in biofilm formation